MKTTYIFWVIVVAIIIFWIEWKKLTKSLKKEKYAITAFLVMSITLAIVLAYFPELPGPSDVVIKVFSPLSKLLNL
jgi:hypothetical protein